MKDHVLVVDDNHDTAEGLALVIRSFGYVTKAVYSGEEAVREMAIFLPDMALIDIGLPGIDGYETIARMRQQRPSAEIVGVAVTGRSGDDDERRAYDSGFDSYITKPVGAERLRGLLALLNSDAPSNATQPWPPSG